MRLNSVELLKHWQLGPGMRLGLWVDGCPFKCKGCVTPELQKSKVQGINLAELISYLLPCLSAIEGITISGGEPFEQSAELYQLIKELRKRKPINVLVYTGYRLGELYQNQAQRELLEVCDAIIDGRYIEKLHRNFFWLGGSDNQSLVALSEIGEKWRAELEANAKEVNESFAMPLFTIEADNLSQNSRLRILRVKKNREAFLLLSYQEQNRVNQWLTNLVVNSAGGWTGIPPKNFASDWQKHIHKLGLETM